MGVATELIDVDRLPLLARESGKGSSENTGNLENEDDAVGRGILVLLLDLVHDGVPRALHLQTML